MKALFLTCLLVYSCTKNSPLSKDAMGLKFTDVKMDISNLNKIDWAVGKFKETKVTQSLVFVVEMPKVDSDDLEYLYEKKGVDAWILRLIVQKGSETQDLGSLYTRFKSRKKNRGQIGGAPRSASIKVYYAAAYPSERLRFLRCPAFEHTKKITNMKISGEEVNFDISFDFAISYPEKSHLVELSPSSFNGGNTLTGKYFIEIAPYNSENKTIHGAFKRIPKYVEVLAEEKVPLKSCAGIHEEFQ